MASIQSRICAKAHTTKCLEALSVSEKLQISDFQTYPVRGKVPGLATLFCVAQNPTRRRRRQTLRRPYVRGKECPHYHLPQPIACSPRRGRLRQCSPWERLHREGRSNPRRASQNVRARRPAGQKRRGPSRFVSRQGCPWSRLRRQLDSCPPYRLLIRSQSRDRKFFRSSYLAVMVAEND